MATWNRRQMLALGIGAIGGFGQLARAQDQAAGAQNIPPPLVQYTDGQDYEIRQQILLDLDGIPADTVELWLPVPQDDLEQTVRDIQTKPKTPLVHDQTGLARVARLLVSTRTLRPAEPLGLEVRYTITCRRTVPDRAALARYTAREYKKDRWYRHYTRAETKIETTDRRIRQIAEKCRGENRPPLEIARAAYDWVIEHTEYQLLDNFSGAAYCLTERHGECSEYSALWVALCRTAGVPARLVSGCWADRKNGWHCWAQFMLPTGQWLPVDPTEGDRNPFLREHHFGAMDNRRVALCKTQDVVLRGVGLRHKAEMLQFGAWWWQGRSPAPKDCKPKAVYTVQGRPIG